MIEKNRKANFLKTTVNYALVLRGDIENISKIKEYLAQYPGIDIVYQRYSFNHLIITERGDTDAE